MRGWLAMGLKIRRACPLSAGGTMVASLSPRHRNHLPGHCYLYHRLYDQINETVSSRKQLLCEDLVRECVAVYVTH